MAVFRKIDETDALKIMVELHERGGGVYGLVMYPESLSPGSATILSTNNPSLSGLDAVKTAERIAREAGQDVFVFDPDNVWDPSWGVLHND